MSQSSVRKSVRIRKGDYAVLSNAARRQRKTVGSVIMQHVDSRLKNHNEGLSALGKKHGRAERPPA